jgi:hypothetical protein
MSRILTIWGRTRVVASLIGVAAALSIAAPHEARAAGEYGYWRGATVYCNEYTNQLWVTARIGHSSALGSQWVEYAHKIRNVDTGAVTYLGPSQGGYWFMFNDNHYFDAYTGVPWASLNVDHDWYPANGRYEVSTMYGWYSGYWVRTGWVGAASYSNIGGTNSYCQL